MTWHSNLIVSLGCHWFIGLMLNCAIVIVCLKSCAVILLAAHLLSSKNKVWLHLTNTFSIIHLDLLYIFKSLSVTFWIRLWAHHHKIHSIFKSISCSDHLSLFIHCLHILKQWWKTASECLIVTLDISIITAMSICVNYIPSNHYRAEISRVDTSFLPLLTYLSDPGLWKLGSSLEMLVHYCHFVCSRVWRDSEGKERDFVRKVVPYLMTLESFHQLSGLTDQDKALWLMFFKVNCRTK